jgi:hypothetical protein
MIVGMSGNERREDDTRSRKNQKKSPFNNALLAPERQICKTLFGQFSLPGKSCRERHQAPYIALFVFSLTIMMHHAVVLARQARDHCSFAFPSTFTFFSQFLCPSRLPQDPKMSNGILPRKHVAAESSLSLSLSLCFWRGLLLRKLTKSSSVREHVWWKNKHLQALENNIFCLLHVDDDVDASSSSCLLRQHACLLLSLLLLLLFLWQFPYSFCILLVGSWCPSAATFWNHSSHIIINKLCD